MTTIERNDSVKFNGMTTTLTTEFGSDYTLDYTLTAVMNHYAGDQYTPESITEIKVTAVQTADATKVYEFETEQVKRYFDQLAGNVNKGIIEYFEWEMIYYLVADHAE